MARQQSSIFQIACLVLAIFLATAGTSTLAATNAPPEVELTPQEHAWLAAHPVIRLGADPAWPPMSFVVSNQLSGIDGDFLRLITERTGIQFVFVPTTSWAETWQLVLDKQVDVVTGTARTPQREEILKFTDPYIAFPSAIITRKDDPFLTSLGNLNGLRVAAPRDYVTTIDLQESHPSATFVYTANTEDALMAVAKGEADLVVGNIAVMSYHIHQRGLETLKISGVNNTDFNSCFGVRTDWPELEAIIAKTLASITPLEREAISARWILPDVQGTVRLHWWRRAVIYGSGVAALVLAVMLFYNRKLAGEIQRRQRVEAQFTTTQDRLVNLNDQKTWFLNIVAHDLKNPIFGVLMAADMLDKLGMAQQGTERKLLDTISESGWRMDRLVKNLLNFNAIEQGTLAFTNKTVDAAAKTREVASRHQHAADTKEVRLALETPAAAVFTGDPDAFVEVVENILANAIKFSLKGETIAITVTVVEGRVRVCIRDNGPGIEESELPGLFKRPADVRLKPTSGGGSTGLGLSIARYFVEAMDGKIWCESRRGEGAAFFLEFAETSPAPAIKAPAHG